MDQSNVKNVDNGKDVFFNQIENDLFIDLFVSIRKVVPFSII